NASSGASAIFLIECNKLCLDGRPAGCSGRGTVIVKIARRVSIVPTAVVDVIWDVKERHWQVRIMVGAEVIKRPTSITSMDADDAELRSIAVHTAEDEGYRVEPGAVTIHR